MLKFHSSKTYFLQEIVKRDDNFLQCNKYTELKHKNVLLFFVGILSVKNISMFYTRIEFFHQLFISLFC